MKHVVIYMEGGGDHKDGKAALRQGMDALLQPLKELARSHALRWKLVPCGGRDRAFRAFGKAAGDNDTLVVLLVDSEGPVSAGPITHLAQRDGWNLRWADEDAIHLMVQVMETWIVADMDALEKYYGRGFRLNQLPRRQDLEEVSKESVAATLERATAATTKGTYHKIWHASDLLARLDPERVKERCRHFRTMWEWLECRLENPEST